MERRPRALNNYDRPLQKTRNEVSLSIFAFLFAEVVEYCLRKASVMHNLEDLDALASSELLLIILPGRSGREAVLRRIIHEVGPVAVLVPERLLEASAWAKPLVTAWIDFKGPGLEDAWRAVSQWMASSGRSISGCTTWDEWGIEICAYLCAPERLHLPYTPLSTVCQVRNKFHFREACRQAALPSCRCANVHRKDELLVALEKEWRYPLILKPARGAGSYYCRKVESKDELLEIFDALDVFPCLQQHDSVERFRSEKKTPEDDVSAGWILEEWFSGLEVDVDGWAKDGDVEWMLVSDNKAVLSHACCETGGVYPSQLPKDLVELLRELTRKVVLACPGLHSAFHFEALINPESKEVMPIELNLRLGGAECPCGVEAVTGIFLPLAAACLALGQPFPWPVHCAPKVKVAASTNEYASHAGIVEACEGSEELYADPDFLGAAFFGTQGATYEPMRGSMSCLCWICAGGGDASEAAENLQRCISLCKLKVSQR